MKGCIVWAYVIITALPASAIPTIQEFKLTKGFTMVSLIRDGSKEFESIKQLDRADGVYIWKYSDNRIKNIKFIHDPALYKSSRSVCLFNDAAVKNNSTKKLDDMWWFLPRDIFMLLKPGETIEYPVYGFKLGKTWYGKYESLRQEFGNTLRMKGYGLVGLIVNGNLLDVPVKILTTENGSSLYVLDNPVSPLIVKWSTADGKSSFKLNQLIVPSMKEDMMTAIRETGRARVYGIYFSFGAADIRDESVPVLKEIADMMKKNISLKIRIEGHTDATGSIDINKRLSLERAMSVKRYLVERIGIDERRLETEGFGPLKPVSYEENEDGRSLNRRVEIVRIP